MKPYVYIARNGNGFDVAVEIYDREVERSEHLGVDLESAQAIRAFAEKFGTHAQAVQNELRFKLGKVSRGTNHAKACKNLPRSKPASGQPPVRTPGAADEADEPPIEPILIELADVQERRVEWVWDGWLPKRKVTILDGDPGMGKSQITMDLAARITTGRPMPPFEAPVDTIARGDVVLLTKEDEPSEVLVPRLRAAGADLTRVSALSAVRDHEGTEHSINLRDNIPQLTDAIQRKRPTLVIVDPITSFNGGFNLNNDSEARELLQPIVALAAEMDVTFLLVRHLNKKEGTSPLYRGGGSVGGIIGICRAAWIVNRSSDDPDKFILAMNKSNYAKFPLSLSYAIEEVRDTSRICWGKESDLTAEQLFGKRNTASKVDCCVAWLRDELANGHREFSSVLERRAKDAGFSMATLKRARKKAGVVPKHDSNFDGGWVSFIPEDAGF